MKAAYDDIFYASIYLKGEDYYYPKGSQPRAHTQGWWAAYGHVSINGQFWGQVRFDCVKDGYYIDYSATYKIKDRYEWFEGKRTPMPFPGGFFVEIPHEWELSLANAKPPRAYMYDFTITWTESEHLFTKDWINWEKVFTGYP